MAALFSFFCLNLVQINTEFFSQVFSYSFRIEGRVLFLPANMVGVAKTDYVVGLRIEPSYGPANDVVCLENSSARAVTLIPKNTAAVPLYHNLPEKCLYSAFYDAGLLLTLLLEFGAFQVFLSSL